MEWDKVGVIQNMLHSLFKHVQLEINGKQLVNMPQVYPYRAYIECLLGFTNDAKKTQLSAAGWFNDDTTTQVTSGINSNRQALIKPTTSTDSEGGECHLMDKLHIDLFQQSKALLGNLNFRLILYPANQNFYLISTDTGLTPSVELKDASFYVHRAIVSDQVVDAQNMILEKATAKYFINRSEVTYHTIETGKAAESIPNVLTGTVPRNVIVAFVGTDAFLGAIGSNPFNFEHLNVTEISSYINGVSYPAIPFTTDFDKGDYLWPYKELLSVVNQGSTDAVMTISRSQFANEFTMFAFQFSQDLSGNAFKSGHISRPKKGTLSINVKFKEALTNSVTMLVFSEYDSLIEIDSERNVFTDYI